MSIAKGSRGFIAHASNADPSSQPDGQPLEYLRTRERAERAAAKRATSTAARRVHQELAQSYAARQVD
jgi:hypothetical protein